jgi:hypothetical protein
MRASIAGFPRGFWLQSTLLLLLRTLFAKIPWGNLLNFDCERFRPELEGPAYQYCRYRFMDVSIEVGLSN